MYLTPIFIQPTASTRSRIQFGTKKSDLPVPPLSFLSAADFNKLNRSEKRILWYRFKGKTSAETADLLNMTCGSVYSAASGILKKLGQQSIYAVRKKHSSPFLPYNVDFLNFLPNDKVEYLDPLGISLLAEAYHQKLSNTYSNLGISKSEAGSKITRVLAFLGEESIQSLRNRTKPPLKGILPTTHPKKAALPKPLSPAEIKVLRALWKAGIKNVDIARNLKVTRTYVNTTVKDILVKLSPHFGILTRQELTDKKSEIQKLLGISP